MKKTIFAFLLCFLLVIGALARKPPRDPAAPSGRFDYYLLALSWAPSYCASHPSDHSRECTARSSFVLHGLWPQAEHGAPPMECGQASQPSAATVDHMLEFMPSRGLIRHEWSKHGTCSGLSADAYFATVERAFQGVRVPEPYLALSHAARVRVSDLERSFARENHAPVQAFRTSCHAGQLAGIEACLDKDLKYRACSSSARECFDNEVSVPPSR